MNDSEKKTGIVDGEGAMPKKRKRKTDRRKRDHWIMGSVMLNDRRWKGERRADRIDGRKK